MATRILNISEYLNLKDVGLLELTFALTPMMSGFNLGSLPLSALMWVVLIVMATLSKKRTRWKNFKPMTIFVVFWAIHEFFILFIDDMNMNNLIVQVLFFVAFYALWPSLDAKKLRGALNIVALIAIIGLLYQWLDILRGNVTHPLEIPGLTMPEERLVQLSLRPSSFFMEPAAYVIYIVCPLTFALLDKKYIWAIIMILSIFLTTSTTGLAMSFILLGTSLLTQHQSKSSVVLILVLGVGLFYALLHFAAFEASIEKVENTDTETNIRLIQGPYVVSKMHADEYIFGAPYSSSYNFCKAGRAPEAVYYGDSVYMSTLWMLLLRFGVVGVLLYLYIYFFLIKKSKKTIPLIVSLIVVMISSGHFIGVNYIFTLILLLTIAKEDIVFLPLYIKKRVQS